MIEEFTFRMSENAEKIKSIALRPPNLTEPVVKKMKVTLCKATKEDKDIVQNLGRFTSMKCQDIADFYLLGKSHPR